MNTVYKVLVFSVFAPLWLNAQNYGQMMYPHSSGGTRMCDALTIEQHTIAPGYVMVAYKDTSSANSYNFSIDRTGLGGFVNAQINSFQKTYQIHANPNEECDYLIRPVTNCAGLSIIETNGANGPGQHAAKYALAGAYSEACFFALIDHAGNCIFSTSYKFPSRSCTLVTQPKIIECSNTPGEYIICGGFNRTMYALRIDASGTILWSNLYPIEGEPRDMIAAAYGPNKDNEFIVVGKTWIDEINTAIDGFVMKLDQQNGSVILSRRLAIWPYNFGLNNLGNQYFNAIEVVKKEGLQPYGYMLGGYTESFSNVVYGSGLLYRVDSVLTMQNAEIYTSPFDSLGGEIVDIMRRQRIITNNPNFLNHYYLLMKTDSGVTVIKRDNFSGWNNPGQGYHYKNSGKILQACKLGMINDMSSPYGGLQIYNTFYGASGSTLPAPHLLTTYFTGHTACNSFTNVPLYSQPATMHFIDPIVPFGGLVRCPSFMITAKEDPGSVSICGPLPSILGGDNSRTVNSPTLLKPEGTVYTRVFPNPAKNKTMVEYDLHEYSKIKLELYNMLGQWVCNIEEDQKEAGTYQTEVNLSALGLEKGVYFVKYHLGAETGSCKLLFEGD